MNERLNVSKPQEHLNLNIKGARPIIASIGTQDDFGEELGLIEEYFKESDRAHNINWGGLTTEFERKKFLNAGAGTYVISTIDDFDKFSQNFYECTGLVVTGIEKSTGENISLMSHQNPGTFLHDKPEEFAAHLLGRLAEIKRRCVPGTIDAIIIGGKDIPKPEPATEDSDMIPWYLGSIKLLGKEVQNILGFEPVVINGPKISSGSDDIYYDNANRRLYFVRGVGNPGAKINPNVGGFVPSDVDKHKDKWK